jgi:ubiquitin carboxyl-terminal hydrolase 7
MLVDQDYEDKQDVAIISPDESMDEADPEPELRGDDFDAIKKRYMPQQEGLDVEAEAIDTWTIQDWRNLGKKEHGPIFKCADHPFRVLFFPTGNNVDHASFYLEHGFIMQCTGSMERRQIGASPASLSCESCSPHGGTTTSIDQWWKTTLPS